MNFQQDSGQWLGPLVGTLVFQLAVRDVGCWFHFQDAGPVPPAMQVWSLKPGPTPEAETRHFGLTSHLSEARWHSDPETTSHSRSTQLDSEATGTPKL